MRILMLSWEYPPHVVGGLGRHVADLVPALDGLGISVDVVTPKLGAGSSRDSIGRASRVHRVPAPANGHDDDFLGHVDATNAALGAAAELVAGEAEVDLIHAHDWLVGQAAAGVKHAHRLPLVATVHATELGRTGGRLNTDLQRTIHSREWELTYEAWRVITTTKYMAREIVAGLDCPADKVDVIPNGVYPEAFTELPPRSAEEMRDFRRRYARDDEPLVVHVGRLVWEKGADLLVEAAPGILSQVPAARIVIAGKGPMLEQLRRRVSELDLGDHVTLTGFVPDEDRDRLYRVADAAVFPSRYEPFGIVALEAMAAGAPVVVSAAGGLAEVVDHETTGVVVASDDVGALVWYVADVLRHPDAARHRAERAQQIVAEEFTWSAIAEQSREIYQRVSHERRAVHW